MRGQTVHVPGAGGGGGCCPWYIDDWCAAGGATITLDAAAHLLIDMEVYPSHAQAMMFQVRVDGSSVYTWSFPAVADDPPLPLRVWTADYDAVSAGDHTVAVYTSPASPVSWVPCGAALMVWALPADRWIETQCG